MVMPENRNWYEPTDPKIRTKEALTRVTEALTSLDERTRQVARDIESAVFMLTLPDRDELAAPTIDYDPIYNTRGEIEGRKVTVYHPKTNRIVQTTTRRDSNRSEELGVDGWIQYGEVITLAMGREINRVREQNPKTT